MTNSARVSSSEFSRWLDAYEAAYSAEGVAQKLACPHCGSRGLNLVFVAFGSSTSSVMPAFWCSRCLRGLPPLRASLPHWASAVPWEEAGLPEYRMIDEQR